MTLKQRAVVEKIANGYEARAAECENTRWSPVSHHKALRACLAAADRATLSEEEHELMSRLRGLATDMPYSGRRTKTICDIDAFTRRRTGGAK
jgi:hypothetical protein